MRTCDLQQSSVEFQATTLAPRHAPQRRRTRQNHPWTLVRALLEASHASEQGNSMVTAREQLSLLRGKSPSPSARAQKTMNALVFFQLNVRLWVGDGGGVQDDARSATHRRTAEQTALRKIRVREHGTARDAVPAARRSQAPRRSRGEASRAREAETCERESFVFLGHGERPTARWRRWRLDLLVTRRIADGGRRRLEDEGHERGEGR